MARDCKNPPKSWSAGVSSGGIAVAASGTAGGAAAGVLDPTPAEASGRGPSSELQPSGSDVSRSWALSNELSQSQDSSSSDLSQSVLLGDAEMIEASGVRKRGISSVDVSSDGAPTRVPASRNGAKKRVSDRASSQEPRCAVHANLPSAASSIPLRKRS